MTGTRRGADTMTRHRAPAGYRSRERAHTAGSTCWVAATLVLATAAPAAAQTPPDSVRSDTVPLLLAPLAIAVERERSAPPPIGALTVDPKVLRRAQAPDAYRLLRQVAGLEVHDQGQGPGYASNVSMRGFTSDHSSDVLLVIDGVPVNLPAHGHVEGYADWNVLMPSSVSSLRVLHGNASPLYGDFALAGAVEVFTRADAESTEASVGGTSFGDVQGSFTTGRRAETNGLFFGLEGRRDEGWRNGAGFWLGNALARGWTQLGEGRLEGGLSLYQSDWDSPGFVSIPDFNAVQFDDAFDLSDGGRSRRAMAHARFSQPVANSAFIQAVGWALASDYSLFLHIPGHSHDGTPGSIQQSGEWDDRTGFGGQVEMGLATDNGDLVFGLTGRSDDVRYRHATTLAREVVNPEVGLDARHLAGAAYARWRFTPTARLGVDLGARLDVLKHESLSDFDPDAGWISATNSVFAPKLGMRYELSNRWSVSGTTARGFRSAVGIIGDPTREPYLAWSHELAMARRGEGWEAELTAFRVDVDNERVFDPITLRSSAAGGSTRQGLDLTAGLDLPRQIRADLGATWNHARMSGPYVDAHNDHPHDVFSPVTPAPAESPAFELHVPGLADWRGRLGISAPLTESIEALMRFEAVGPHVPIGEPSVQTQTYSIFDVGFSWATGHGGTLDVEVGNLFDVRHVELRSSGFVTPGAPRALRVQMSFDSLSF